MHQYPLPWYIAVVFYCNILTPQHSAAVPVFNFTCQHFTSASHPPHDACLGTCTTFSYATRPPRCRFLFAGGQRLQHHWSVIAGGRKGRSNSRFAIVSPSPSQSPSHIITTLARWHTLPWAVEPRTAPRGRCCHSGSPRRHATWRSTRYSAGPGRAVPRPHRRWRTPRRA